MSTVLERALDAIRRQQAEAADAGTPVRLVHETPRCDLLSDEQCAAMDDCAGIDDMRNTLIRAEFVARVRRFDSRFGGLV